MAPKSISENMAGSFGVHSTSGASASGLSMGSINMAAAAGLESLEVNETNVDEIISNVEKMIKAEKIKDKAAKQDKKSDDKTLDVTGVAIVKSAPSTKLASEVSARRGTTTGKESSGSLTIL